MPQLVVRTEFPGNREMRDSPELAGFPMLRRQSWGFGKTKVASIHRAAYLWRARSLEWQPQKSPEHPSLSYQLNTDKCMDVRKPFEVKKGMTERKQSKQYMWLTQGWIWFTFPTAGVKETSEYRGDWEEYLEVYCLIVGPV